MECRIWVWVRDTQGYVPAEGQAAGRAGWAEWAALAGAQRMTPPAHSAPTAPSRGVRSSAPSPAPGPAMSGIL